VCYRKILSADTEATKQNSSKDETTKKEENQSSVHEGFVGDSTCSSSVNIQKLDGSDSCLENVEDGQAPDLEPALSHTKDNTPDMMETSTSVSQADADSICGNDPKHTTDDKHNTTFCSPVSAEQSNCSEETAENNYNNTDVDTVASVPVCDSAKHRTEACCSGATLEQTDLLTHSKDDTLSGVGGDTNLQSEQPNLSVHSDSNTKSSTESAIDLCPGLSPALMNEVISD